MAVCMIPGCVTDLVEVFGEVCDACIDAFGPMPRHGGPPVTEQRIADRDEQIRAAYRARHAVKTEPAVGASIADAGGFGHLDEGKADTLTSMNTVAAGSVQRKRNQKCWLCEERRTCTRQPQGWEMPMRCMSLTEDQQEILRQFGRDDRSWCRPIELGGTDGSRHSAVLAHQLEYKGFGESWRRPGNGYRPGCRGSKLYRLTTAGLAGAELQSR